MRLRIPNFGTFSRLSRSRENRRSLDSNRPEDEEYCADSRKEEEQHQERAPLLSAVASSSSSPVRGARSPAPPYRDQAEYQPLCYTETESVDFEDHGENSAGPLWAAGIMEKVKNTKAAKFVDKLAVESEPGLTNAQLLLYNFDLKPVEPERRQWGAWNFVGFWIGTF